MKSIHITAASWAVIEAHAIACYPHEACGFIVDRDGQEEAVCVTNIQSQRHAEDPTLRDARTAYTMGAEAAPILIGYERHELTIRAIFHSHPDHDAYFSAEDRKQATVWDQPSYPDAGQIVISVYGGVSKGAKAFAWDAAANDYAEVSLRVE